MSKGGSKTQTVVSSTEPPAYAQPFLEEALGGAQQLYQQGGPQYFPGSTVTDFSPQTTQALGQVEARANAGSPLQQAGNNAALQTLQGGFLQGNPYFNGAVQAAIDPVIANVQSQFSQSGRLGSGANQDVLARSIGDITSNMSYANYAAERGRQQDMIGQAPGLAQADYNDPLRLAGVGAAREDQARAQLQGNLDRYNFEQQAPYSNLESYLASIRGGTFGNQSSQPVFSNPASSFLGGALGGASLGSTLGVNPVLGAVGGGLLGLL